MNPYQAAVRQFHSETGSTVGDTVAIRDAKLRASLILEEAVETVAALGFHAEASLGVRRPYPAHWHSDGTACIENYIETLDEFEREYETPNIAEVVDGLCDLLYVTLGTAVAAGIDLDPYFWEVHRSNMEKLTGPKRADGKQLKPEGWRPPRIESLLAQEKK